MRCLYINLDAAEDRRRDLEASFTAAAPAGWTLERTPAVNAGKLPPQLSPLTPPERACWASHLRVLESVRADEGAVLVVEDDTIFSPEAFAVLPRMLEAAPDYDLVFGDLIPTDIMALANLTRRWPKLANKGHSALEDLTASTFAGASAYMLRASAAPRLVGALQDRELQALPYDLALGRLVRIGKLRAGFCFPFVTAPGPHADASSIQDAQSRFRDAAFNAYRRLLFVRRDLAQCRRDAEQIEASHEDEAAKLAGNFLGAFLSSAFEGAP